MASSTDGWGGAVAAAGTAPGRRLALVVATGDYDDPALARLRAPAGDAAALSDLLADPAVGGFDVTAVLDQDANSVRLAVEELVSDRRPDDLLLLYLSCHGLVDLRRRLYFAARDTRRDRLASSGVASHWVLEQLEDCRARRQVVILDCCFSGAFAAGGKGPSDQRDLGLGERLLGQGRGRVVLTASRATEYSFEGEPLDTPERVSERGSVFTRALLTGIRSGAADTDNDGWISVDDAYAYAYDRVSADEAAQTPQRWLYGAEGSILLARSPHAATVDAAAATDPGRTVGPDAPRAESVPARPAGGAAWWRRRGPAAAIGSGVLVVALVVVLLLALHGPGTGGGSPGSSGSSGDGSSATAGALGGISAGRFDATGPWRLVVGDHAVGADPGCTFTVVDDTGQEVHAFEAVYAKEQHIQLRDRGRFTFRVSGEPCLLRAVDGAGEAGLPFEWSAGKGDTDGISTDGKVVVRASFPKGTSSCELLLHSVADGHTVDAKTLTTHHDEEVLDPGGSAAVYFSGTTCDLAVRKPT
jgi:uncharacterized caspase-like protein